jgi:hypothetical protein
LIRMEQFQFLHGESADLFLSEGGSASAKTLMATLPPNSSVVDEVISKMLEKKLIFKNTGGGQSTQNRGQRGGRGNRGNYTRGSWGNSQNNNEYNYSGGGSNNYRGGARRGSRGRRGRRGSNHSNNSNNKQVRFEDQSNPPGQAQPQQQQIQNRQKSGGGPPKDLSNVTCYSCGNKGHYSNTCQNASKN